MIERWYTCNLYEFKYLKDLGRASGAYAGGNFFVCKSPQTPPNPPPPPFGFKKKKNYIFFNYKKKKKKKKSMTDLKKGDLTPLPTEQNVKFPNFETKKKKKKVSPPPAYSAAGWVVAKFSDRFINVKNPPLEKILRTRLEGSISVCKGIVLNRISSLYS